MPMSIRLDRDLDHDLEEIARRQGRTKSEVARQAIEDLVARERLTPYERTQHLLGIATGGPSDLSERTGERFRELLQAKQR